MKKILFSLLVLTISTSIYAHDIEVPNADGVTIYYNFINNDTELEVSFRGSYTSSYSNEYIGNVVIPEEVTYKNRIHKVTSIGYGAFDRCSGLTSIEIPNSVTRIRESAFVSCSGLTTVTIGNSVTSIENNAFSSCSGLTSVTIPNSVTSIGSYAFYDCSDLTSVTIPNSVKRIGESAFRGCSALTSVVLNSNIITSKSYESDGSIASIFGEQVKEYILGDDVTAIGNSAFCFCSKLTSVTIPNSVTSIGEAAFYGCSGLTSVTIPNSVTSIGLLAFGGCSGLTSIEIPNSVTNIGDYAFYGCSSLTNVKLNSNAIVSKSYNRDSSLKDFFGKEVKEYIIGENVTSIGSYAFYDCSDLTSVTIPNSVTSIGFASFEGCSGLTSVNILDIPAWCKVSFAYSSSNPLYYAKHLFIDGKEVKDLIIPNSVTSIGGSTFYGCSGLTSVTIPNSVTSIGTYAFSGCSDLSKVTLNSTIVSRSYNHSSTIENIFGSQVKEYILGDDVASIGNYAFDGCSGLMSVIIPNSVTSIGSYAFSGCSGLTSVTIPNSMTSVGEGAFSDCTNLNKVIVRDFTAWCKINFGSYDANPLYYVNHLYRDDNTEIKDLIIPNSVTNIGTWAFSGCSGLTSITIPQSVTSIGNGAFSGCSGLTSITIPQSVTSIGNNAFYNCPDLTKVTLNSNEVVSKSFSSSFTFKNIFGSQVSEYILGDEIISIGNYAFKDCSGLKSVTIPNSVTSIGNYSFSGCVFEKKYFINNSSLNAEENNYWGAIIVEYGSIINKGVLTKYLGNLYSVVIPSNVTSIESSAFSSKPTKVIWLTNTPPEGYANAAGIVNYVANNNYTDLSNKTVYSFLSSMFEVDGIRYVPVSPSERTCDAIDCIYDESAEKINIGEKVTNKGISLTVKQVQPYTCYGNTFIKDVNLGFAGDLGDYAFNGCTSITSATISNQGYIGSHAFEGCTGIETVTISNQENIGESAFDGCTNINTVTINNKGDIGKNAFRECLSITKIDLGNGVTSIGSSAFYRCSKLSSITIPDAVTSIGIYAFNDCTALNSIKIGSGVKSIGYYAFWNCAALEKIQIPQSVTSIDNYVFKGCTGLNTVIIDNGNSELSISSNGSSPLFADCPLDSVYIGRNITYNTSSSYGYSPFYRNTSLRTVVITDKETEISDNEFYGCTNLQSFKVGDGVTKFGNYAFSGCSKLESIEIPDAVTSIGTYSFSNCSTLSSAKIGNGVKAIPSYTFSGCSSLEDVQIGKNITSIGEYAFNGCSTLPKIQIPKSVNSIANCVFKGCTRLKTVIMDNGDSDLSLSSNGSNPMFADCPLDSVYIGRNITYNTSSSYGYSPFYRNTSLRTVVITDKETEISDNEFYGCTNLQSFKVGDGVTKFGNYAFSGCSSLKSLSFGTKLQSIGQEAFSDCTAITSIVSSASTPPTCGSQALDDINKWDCLLYVPKGTLSDYQAADQWKEFFFIEEFTKEMEDAVTEVKAMPVLIQAEGNIISVQGAAEGTEISAYNVNGIKLSSTIANKGITTLNTQLPSGSTAIVKIGEKTVKVLMK